MPLLKLSDVLTEIRVGNKVDVNDAWQLLAEYFEAGEVVVRDTREDVLHYLQDARSGIWLAYCDGEAAGCISLRPLASDSGEIKRLYVRPKFRRFGLASRLLAALESYSVSIGLQTLYLDTKDDFLEAIAFYERAGYQRCERYNDNPQATIFLKKNMALPIQVREFLAGDEAAFWSLNEAWISKLFILEEKDLQILRNPQEYILSQGGRIYMACRGDWRVGCCALLDMGGGSYELAKMGVAESERGKGVGRALLVYAITHARQLGMRRLYIETNHRLENAIHLYGSVGFSHMKPEDIKPSPYARADVFMEMHLS